MRVFSKIIEADQLVCDLEIPEMYKENAIVEEHTRHFSDEKLASFRVNITHSNGLYIQKTKIHAYQDITDNFYTHGQHIRFFFYLKGQSKVQQGAGNHDYEHAVGMLQRNYLDKNGGGSTVRIKRGDQVNHAVIKMSRMFYLQLLKDEPWISDDPFHQYILNGDPENRPNETYYMNTRILVILQDILDSGHIREHRYHYLKIKFKELLFAIHQHTQLTARPVQKSLSSGLDVLEKIRAHLIFNLDNPPNITELSKTFMLNEKKLKEDFKKTYGCTVYAFVIRERMKRAQTLLYKNYNVSELASLLGYHSVSHFIKVFKAFHGCTPKEALNKFQALTAQAKKGGAA